MLARHCSCPVFVVRPTEHRPAQRTHLHAEQAWDFIAVDMNDLATKQGYSRVFLRAGTVKREVLVRKLGRRLTVQLSTARARLNPKVYSSVADGCERSGSQQVLVVRTAPVIQYCILRRQVRPVQIQPRVNVFRLNGDDAPVMSGGRNFWRRHVRNGRR